MKKGIFQITIANIISLIIGLITNFVLPAFLSIETYAHIKTYSFYISYAGVFTLGYCDGMYLRYGGKRLGDINSEEISNDFGNNTFLLILAGSAVLLLGLYQGNTVLCFFAIGLVFYDLLGTVRLLCQAVGEYKLYSFSINCEKLIIFITSIILLFIFNSNDPYVYISVQILASVIILLLILFPEFIRKGLLKKIKVCCPIIRETIREGFVLMIGNLSVGIFTGIDRWFIKLLMTSVQFAYYSYAISMETVIGLFMSPLTVVMYNYFCLDHEKREIMKIKRLIAIWGFVLIATAFPAKFILINFIPKYKDSISVLFWLFLAQAFMFVVQGVYINLYKAKKQQALYLKQIIEMIIIAILTNSVFYIIVKKMDSFAIATAITSIIWFAMCEKKYYVYRFSKRESIGIILISIIYIMCGYSLNPVTGLIVYSVGGIILLYIFWNDIFMTCVNYCKKLTTYWRK